MTTNNGRQEDIVQRSLSRGVGLEILRHHAFPSLQAISKQAQKISSEPVLSASAKESVDAYFSESLLKSTDSLLKGEYLTQTEFGTFPSGWSHQEIEAFRQFKNKQARITDLENELKDSSSKFTRSLKPAELDFLFSQEHSNDKNISRARLFAKILKNLTEKGSSPSVAILEKARQNALYSKKRKREETEAEANKPWYERSDFKTMIDYNGHFIPVEEFE